jgi:DnaJ domain
MVAVIHRLGDIYYPWRYALESPYNADFVEALKAYVPYRQRRWVPDDKKWWFQSDVIATVEYLCDRYYGSYVHVGRAGKEEKSHQNTRTPNAQPDAYATLHLLPSAPSEVVTAAYRALAKKFHPDHGGDDERMKQINLAYERLRQ